MYTVLFVDSHRDMLLDFIEGHGGKWEYRELAERLRRHPPIGRGMWYAGHSGYWVGGYASACEALRGIMREHGRRDDRERWAY